MARDRTMLLPDGRQLGFDDIGDADGKPVLFMHGTPGSRLYWTLAGPGRPVHDAGVRLIAPDRPGMGLSDPQPERTVDSLVEDMERLAGSLGIDRMAVIGFSGGTAYALALAARRPDLVMSLALVAPICDLTVPSIRAHVDPSLKRGLSLACGVGPVIPLLLREAGTPSVVSAVAERVWARLPASDRRVLGSERVHSAAARTIEEAARQGLEGARLDLEILCRPWEFSLSDVQAPVSVFTGASDPWSTEEMAHWLEVGLRRCRVFRLTGEGHFTILVNHGNRVLETVLMPVVAA